MKLMTCLILGAGLLLPVVVSAHRPRPEEAVAALELSPQVREQVLATFAAAKARHEALRKTADTQRAANDAAFCAIRSETQAALAKILGAAQLDALNAEMRPPRPRDEARPGRGMRGSMHGPATGLRGRPPRPMSGARGDDRRPPPPPQCDATSTPTSAGE